MHNNICWQLFVVEWVAKLTCTISQLSIKPNAVHDSPLMVGLTFGCKLSDMRYLGKYSPSLPNYHTRSPPPPPPDYPPQDPSKTSSPSTPLAFLFPPTAHRHQILGSSPPQSKGCCQLTLEDLGWDSTFKPDQPKSICCTNKPFSISTSRVCFWKADLQDTVLCEGLRKTILAFVTQQAFAWTTFNWTIKNSHNNGNVIQKL